MAVKDLSPKLDIKNAEQELYLPPGTDVMGQSVGGVSAFSQVFKRGYGENVFGVSEQGMWLGGADFDNATIQFYFSGTVIITDKETGKKRVMFGKFLTA